MALFWIPDSLFAKGPKCGPQQQTRSERMALTVVLALTLGMSGGIAKTLRPPVQSLVVLPFENLSGDPSQDYFADGMTDALITDLARIGSLQVISRTSAMHYKRSHQSLPEIARELNVDAVVEGGVVRSGGRVRISAQLIQASSDRHLWARAYDRDAREILSLQREVAESIVREIQAKMTAPWKHRRQRAGNAKLRSLRSLPKRQILHSPARYARFRARYWIFEASNPIGSELRSRTRSSRRFLRVGWA